MPRGRNSASKSGPSTSGGASGRPDGGPREREDVSTPTSQINPTPHPHASPPSLPFPDLGITSQREASTFSNPTGAALPRRTANPTTVTYALRLRRRGGGFVRLRGDPNRATSGAPRESATTRATVRTTTTEETTRGGHKVTGVKELVHCSVQKLKGAEEYETWSYLMELVLRRYDVWGVVSGEVRKPRGGEELKEWEAKSESGLLILASNVEASQLTHIRMHRDAPGAWGELKKVYQRERGGGMVALRMQLHALKQEDGEGLDAFATRMKDIFYQLTNVGDPIPPKDQVINLLSSVHPRYATEAQMLQGNYSFWMDPSFGEAVNLLRMGETMRAQREAKYGTRAEVRPTVLLAKAGEDPDPKPKEEGEDKPKGPKDKRHVVCHQCGKKGHYKKECWDLVGRPKKEGESSTSRPNPYTERSNFALGGHTVYMAWVEREPKAMMEWGSPEKREPMIQARRPQLMKVGVTKVRDPKGMKEEATGEREVPTVKEDPPPNSDLTPHQPEVEGVKWARGGAKNAVLDPLIPAPIKGVQEVPTVSKAPQGTPNDKGGPPRVKEGVHAREEPPQDKKPAGKARGTAGASIQGDSKGKDPMEYEEHGDLEEEFPPSFPPPELPTKQEGREMPTNTEKGECRSHTWYLDSGATHHMTAHEGWLTHVEPIMPVWVGMGDGKGCWATKKGEMYLEGGTGMGEHGVLLRHVLYVPGLTTNLISIDQLTQEGMQVVFTKEGYEVKSEEGTVWGKGASVAHLYPWIPKVLSPRGRGKTRPKGGIMQQGGATVVLHKEGHKEEEPRTPRTEGENSVGSYPPNIGIGPISGYTDTGP
jgi:hypothetical protein